ncbi:Glutathione S-transferase 3 [Bulinus truncatus]|nr:Glutathione S-transferase 3 [Bulinus truncatus]
MLWTQTAKNMTSKKFKLIYFDFRARAEVSRLLLAAGGQDYEDVRIPESQWPQEKKKMPFGQVPVLQIGEKMFAQSVAIETYLARELGLHGKTNLESLMIDQVVQFNQEFRAKAVTAIKELDSNRKAELIKNVKEVEVPRYFTHLEQLLKENDIDYFVGSSLTYADISTYDNIYAFSTRGPLLELSDDNFPLLKSLYNRVENTERIKEYLANRKKTEL